MLSDKQQPAAAVLHGPSVAALMAELEQSHEDMMASFADSVREHALTDVQEKLELSEARNAALEARVSDLEEQLAKQAAESSKWKQMPPALVAMLGKQGMSNEEKAALEQLAGLGTEVAELRQTVHAQSEMLGEMSSDVEHMANGLYDPAVDASGPPGGSASVSPPTLDSNAPRTSSLARRNFLVTRMQKQLRKVEGVLTEGKGPLADQLKKLDRQVGEQIHTISSELRDLRTAHEETSQAHAAAEGSLAQMRDSMAADVERAATDAASASAATGAMGEHLAALEREKVSQQDFDALTDAMREMRGSALVGGGGGESDRELLAAVQAAQQSTQSHVLSLQTHLRALLRKAEAEKASEVPTVDIAVVDSLRAQVHEALHELQGQVSALAAGKADADRVEAALETKAERKLMAAKADRAFCEALLARFAVEVGRQLGDMEHNQVSIRGSLEEAVVRLMRSSVDVAAAPAHNNNSGGGAGEGSGPLSTPLNIKVDGLAASEPFFDVKTLRVRSAGPSRRGGKPARGVRGWQGVDEPAPKLEGKGQLAMSLFVTGEGEPPTLDPQRHGFQPRRAQLNMTPGEQTLTPTFITRKRPTTAAGRLTGSASAGLLSVPRPGSGQQGKQ